MTRVDPQSVTFVRSAKPNSSDYFAAAQDRPRIQQAHATEGTARVYARFRVALPARMVLSTAVLEVKPESAWTGSTQARSVDPDSGAYRAMTYNNAPAPVAGSADRSGVFSDGWLRYDVKVDVDAALTAGERVAFRLTSGTTARQWLTGPDGGRGSIRLTLMFAPVTTDPVDLGPVITALDKPVLSWTAQVGITKVQAQVDELGGDWATLLADSGEVVTTTPSVDTATLAWAGIADAASVQVRVRHFTSAGWSAWTVGTVTRDAPTTFAVTNPATSPGEDADPTFPSVWSPAAEAFQVITYVDGVKVANSGLRAGPETSYTPPAVAVKKGQSQRRVHRLYDGSERDDHPYAEIVTETTFTPSTTVAGMSSLQVVQAGELPCATVYWSRTAGVPDEVALYHGDRMVARPNGPDGSWRDWWLPPNTDFVYGARAVVNGQQSDAEVRQNVRTKVTGIWLVDPNTERGVRLSGIDGLSIAYGDVTVVHTPLDGAELLRRTLVLRGPEGSVVGRIADWPDRTDEQQKADVEWLRERPGKRLRLIMGDLNVPVYCSSLQVLFDPETTFHNRVRHNVSFSFSHAGGW